MLQLWVDAADTAHRVDAGKLAGIVELGGPLLGDEDLAVEVEYDVGVVTKFADSVAESTPSGVLFRLEGRRTTWSRRWAAAAHVRASALSIASIGKYPARSTWIRQHFGRCET